MTAPASSCPACQRVAVPPRPRCPGCGAPAEETVVGGEGTLLSWTVLRSPPAGHEPGRVVGVVGLEDGARALALGPAEDEVPELGASVVVEEGDDGRLRFRPADG